MLKLALVFGATMALVPSALAQSSEPRIARVPFERYILANGLTVILAPMPSSPAVQVDVLYHVGSMNC